METRKIGNKGIMVGVVGSLHGNELIGKQIIQKLNQNFIPSGVIIKTIVANTEAIKKNKRFVEIDGNRCFPGSKDGKLEERLAHKLIYELKDCSYVLDIHSTYAKQPDTLIITKKSMLNHVAKSPIKKVLIMGKKIAHGRSLIDYVTNGMSIEFSRSRKPEAALRVVKATIQNISKGKDLPQKKEIYEVIETFGKRRDKINAQNFKKISNKIIRFSSQPLAKLKGLFPIFIGEKSYSAFCMVAKKIS